MRAILSIRSTIIVAILQVGVIVTGVLVARAWTLSGFGAAMPFPTAMLYSYGVLGFSVPIFWSAYALTLLRRPEVSDKIKSLIFWSGVLVLIILAIFVSYADVQPWFNLDYIVNK